MSALLRSVLGSIYLLLMLSSMLNAAQKDLQKCWDSSKQKTLLIMCSDKAKRVLSPVALSEGDKWRAYVEVDIQSDCLHTTRLWVSDKAGSYRVVYMIAPKRTAYGNGMEILGWANDSRMLLVRTAEWTYGSDMAPGEQVLAIDAGTGMVYEPELGAMLHVRKNRQCRFCVVDAGFASEPDAVVLIRAKFQTWLDAGETEQDVPPAKRCGNSEETWSFNFATGEVKQEPDAEPLELFKKFLPRGNAIIQNED